MRSTKKLAPKLPFLDAIADAPTQLYKQVMDYPVEVMQKLGDFYRMPSIFKSTNYMVMNPDAVEQILKTNRDNYTKENQGYKRLEIGLGKCLLTTAGDTWTAKRKIMQPAFHSEYFLHYTKVMTSTTAEFFQSWLPLAANGKIIRLCDEMMKLGFFIATRTLLSMDFDGSAEKLIADAHFLQDYAFAKRSYLPTPQNIRYLWVMRRMNRFSRAVIDKHETMPTGDMVDLILRAREEPNCGWDTFKGIEAEVRMLLITGYETVATTLTWMLFVLSIHSNYWEPLQEEVDRVLGQRTPEYEDMRKLTYSKMFINETLRLFPAIMATNRLSLADDVICGYDVPRKSNLMINFYGVHRNPEYWPEAAIFDPERFSEQNKRQHKKYSFVPFGAGPRTCIASHYAMLELQLIFAMLVQRFTLQNKSTKAIVPVPMVTLRPSREIRSQIILR